MSSIIDAFPDILKIRYGLVPIEILVFIFDFEYEFVCSVLHGDNNTVVLEDDSVDRSYHLVDPVYLDTYDAISLISMVTKPGV